MCVQIAYTPPRGGPVLLALKVGNAIRSAYAQFICIYPSPTHVKNIIIISHLIFSSLPPCSGIYKVYINDKHISTYTHTGLFGELALLYNMPRWEEYSEY